MHLPNHYISRN